MKKSTSKGKKERVIRSRDHRPFIIIVAGFILGGLLIELGVSNNINSEYNSIEVKSEEQLIQEVSEKTKKVEEIREKRNEEYNISALSEDYEKYSRELSLAESELYDSEAELYNVKNGIYDKQKQDMFLSSIPLIVLGAVVIVAALGLAMRISTHKRKNVILTVSEEK